MLLISPSVRRNALYLPVLAATLLMPGAVSAQTKAAPKAQGAAGLNEFGNPFKLAPRPTTAPINEADLRTRLYIFSDDSMMGRQLGREGNMKGTQYIADELKKLGIQPGAWDGSYFQNFGFIQRKYTSASKLTVNGQALTWNTDYVAVPSANLTAVRQIDTAQVIFGGVTGDTVAPLSAALAAGKVVLMLPRPAGVGGGGRQGGGGGRQGGGGGRQGGAGGGQQAAAPVNPLADAAAVITIDLDALTMASRAELNNPQAQRPAGGGGGRGGNAAPAPTTASAPTLRVTRAAAERLLGRSLTGATVGTLGGKVSSNLVFVSRVTNYARNVIGIIPGSDPKLKGQYVAISAHNDHVGYSNGGGFPSHDSVRAVLAANMVARIQGDTLLNMSPELAGSIKPINFDSIRKVHPNARVDSIRNGADDDGSGSMGILEIAEAIQKSPVKPKRSIIFIWHTGEEAGMDGSSGFVRDPSIPLDSIVTAINVDMIGRGREGDIPGGGPKYLGVVGSRVLSQDLGEEVLIANKKQPKPFSLDFRYDKPTTGWAGYDNIYGRSDHINYARAGIPIVFFFTGLHADYHQPTDEAQYIDYPHYASITRYIKDLLVDIANRPTPPKLDKPKVIVP